MGNDSGIKRLITSSAEMHCMFFGRKAMTFIEMQFFVFLFAVSVIFYICPVKHRWKVLLGASIVFYAIAGIKYLPFIFITSFTVFLAGRKMGHIYEEMEQHLEGKLDRKAKKEMKEQAKNRCRKAMLAALLFNLLILIVVKFTKFAVNPINDLLTALGREGNFSASYIIVPLGISYYTFSCLSYLLDVYWKREEYESNYARFLLYAIYFPHILQGPIERYGRLGKRLKGEFLFDYDRVCAGLQLMVWGIFKKLVIADRINLFTTAVYKKGSQAEGLIYVFAFFLDVVYIYADFSGCMDIARGASQIFGVELDLNFNHPFASKSVTEFWRRWHMSLGSWFKDYVYYPISTSKFVKNVAKSCKKHLPDAVTRSIVTAIPVTVTWVATGLWHGTGVTYLAWGLYYAFMIFMSVSFGDMFHNLALKLKINTRCGSYKVFQMVRTTCIFAGGRLLTRPGTLGLSWHALKSALLQFNPWVLTDGSLYEFGLSRSSFNLMLVTVVLFGGISILQQKGSVRDMIAKQNLIVRWGLCFAAIFSILIFGIYGSGYDAASFVYMAY